MRHRWMGAALLLAPCGGSDEAGPAVTADAGADVAADDGQAGGDADVSGSGVPDAVTLTGPTLAADAHRLGILLVDEATGEPLSLGYGVATTQTVEGGVITGGRCSWTAPPCRPRRGSSASPTLCRSRRR